MAPGSTRVTAEMVSALELLIDEVEGGWVLQIRLQLTRESGRDGVPGMTLPAFGQVPIGEIGMDTLRHGEDGQAEFLDGHIREARRAGSGFH